MTREEELRKQQQQGIGEAAYHEPQQGIGTPASNPGQNQGIGTPAYHEPAGSIGTPASKQPQTGIGTPANHNLNQAAQQPIQVMPGVTQGTAQKMQQAQQGYQPGAAATAAQQQLQQLMNSKPQGYNSNYVPQMDRILQEIQGQKEFKYEFNGDPLFRSLADMYTQQAKQASLNAQGQAAALTGGYGNSAAQLAGSQAYQQAILPLYDRGTELAQMAYQQHQGAQADRYNQLSALLNMEQNAYGQHRDEVADWQNERNFAADRYDTEEDRGYNRHINDLNYWTGLAQVENADYRDEQARQEAIRQYNQDYDMRQQQFEWQKDVDQRDYDRNVLESDRAYNENVRQFEESLNWDKMSAEQKYNMQLALAILEQGKMPSEEMLAAAGISAEDAQLLMAQIATGGGGGGKQKQPVYYVDIAGNYYQDDGKGGYTPVRPQDVDPNGLEDRSKINQITGQNLANTWTAASRAQEDKKMREDAALAAQQKAADRAAKESRENIRQLLRGVDISKLLNR